jgi:hypothetical protein
MRFTKFDSLDQFFGNFSELSLLLAASPHAIQREVAQSGMTVTLPDVITAIGDEVSVLDRI